MELKIEESDIGTVMDALAMAPMPWARTNPLIQKLAAQLAPKPADPKPADPAPDAPAPAPAA